MKLMILGLRDIELVRCTDDEYEIDIPKDKDGETVLTMWLESDYRKNINNSPIPVWYVELQIKEDKP